MLGTVLVLGFVALVVVSTRNAAVPVGATGTPTMAMSTGANAMVQLMLRDVYGRSLRLPGNEPGIVVFVAARGCDSCVAAVRDAADVIRSADRRAALTVINIDSRTSRADVAAFARAAGRPAARYVVDDPMGTLASTMGVSDLASMVVYDARGHVVGRPSPAPAQAARAFHIASQ